MMRRTPFFIVFFSMLFLFYPGEHPYIRVIAGSRNLFISEKQNDFAALKPIPYNKTGAFPDISARGVYVVEAGSFTPIFERNTKVRFFPASITKIITALVARDLYKLDEVISVKVASQEGQLMDLVQGERITVENLLYGMLVQSGNDAAYALAYDYGFDKYMKKMEEKARSLSMQSSTFTNPAGLDEPEQLTTPYDMALAARALLDDPTLRKMVSTKEIIISDVDYNRYHTLTNVNKLLGEVQGLGGLKTGYTELAGENLVSFYRHAGHDYIMVILKSEDRFKDTTAIVEWIKSNVAYVDPQLKTL